MAKRRPPPKTSHTSSSKAAGASRRKTALQLHIEGHTFLVIGERLGVSRRQAERLIAATAAAQHDPTALRVVRLPVRIGSGARRDALHILWPVH